MEERYTIFGRFVNMDGSEIPGNYNSNFRFSRRAYKSVRRALQALNDIKEAHGGSKCGSTVNGITEWEKFKFFIGHWA